MELLLLLIDITLQEINSWKVKIDNFSGNYSSNPLFDRVYVGVYVSLLQGKS
jgi:hypothetical protein